MFARTGFELVVLTLVALGAPLARGTDPTPVERYEALISALREAETLDFDAEVVNVRNKDGARTKTTTRFEASLARGDRGWIRRSTNGDAAGVAATDDRTEPRVLIEMVADGDVTYQIDREAGAYVRLWPPRFLSAGDSRGIMVLREFLSEATESPVLIRESRHPKLPELEGAEVVFGEHSELIYFEADGTPRIVVRVDSKGSIRTTYTFREFTLGRQPAAADYTRKPPSEFEDVTTAFARSAPLSFQPAAAPAGSVGKAPPALLPGAREVDAAFLDRTRALVRLSTMRSGMAVVVFVDRDAPQYAETLRRLRSLAQEAERRSLRTQFIAVYDSDPPARASNDPKNLRFVKPLRAETAAAFGVFYYPTTFVVDRGGSVVLRAAVMFDVVALRSALGM